MTADGLVKAAGFRKMYDRVTLEWPVRAEVEALRQPYYCFHVMHGMLVPGVRVFPLLGLSSLGT